MSWDWDRDIYINREASHEQIAAILSQFFNVKADQVVVSVNHEWMDKQDDNTHVVCDITHMKGDFPLGLLILPFKDKFDSIPLLSLETVGILCEMLQCHALVHMGDVDPFDPYVYTLVKGAGDYQVVEVDTRQLDYHDSFVIAKYL